MFALAAARALQFVLVAVNINVQRLYNRYTGWRHSCALFTNVFINSAMTTVRRAVRQCRTALL